jgi:hypothetical protein
LKFEEVKKKMTLTYGTARRLGESSNDNAFNNRIAGPPKELLNAMVKEVQIKIWGIRRIRNIQSHKKEHGDHADTKKKKRIRLQ